MSKKVEPKKESESGATEWKYDPALVSEKLRNWFPELSDKNISDLVGYQTELLKFNNAVNLISESTTKTAESTHVADCVLATGLIAPLLVSDHPVYDFGSGNGCPGLIFALLKPQIKVVLVDRDERKLEFCKHAASKLGISNLSTLAKSVDSLPAQSVKNVISRGFAPLQKALLVCRKPVARGGRFFHMKGDGWANELANLPSQIFSHWTPSLVGQYKIPGASDIEMSVVLTEKISD